MPSISPAISQRSRGLSGGHLNQVVCLLPFRLWPARRCAQGHDLRYRYGRGYLRNIHGTRGRGKSRPATPGHVHHHRRGRLRRQLSEAHRHPSPTVLSHQRDWPGRDVGAEQCRGTVRPACGTCAALLQSLGRPGCSGRRNCNVNLDELRGDRPDLDYEPQQAGGIPRNVQLDETDAAAAMDGAMAITLSLGLQTRLSARPVAGRRVCQRQRGEVG